MYFPTEAILMTDELMFESENNNQNIKIFNCIKYIEIKNLIKHYLTFDILFECSGIGKYGW